MAKTKKLILKRFKITKNGKVLHRPIGQDHFRAKKNSKKIRKFRKGVKLSKTDAKAIKRFLR